MDIYCICIQAAIFIRALRIEYLKNLPAVILNVTNQTIWVNKEHICIFKFCANKCVSVKVNNIDKIVYMYFKRWLLLTT